MLSPKSVNRKTYEELMEENLGKIPIYTDEWTNFNPSDPGITMLENLSAFQIYQHDMMGNVSDAVKMSLMKLLGYTPNKGSGAKVYIEPQGLTERMYIPADQRYMVGSISFETTLARTMTASHIVGIYGIDESGSHNYSYILEKDMTISAAIMGKNPEINNQVYIELDKPLDPGEQATIYVEVVNAFKRNRFIQGQENLFAELKWECYTQDGFKPIKVIDDTYGFLLDGYIQVQMPQIEAKYYKDDKLEGYVWRVTLVKSEYDVAPLVKSISNFLFPAIQKETLVIAHTFQKSSSVTIKSHLLEDGFVKVFCKEKKGSSYRLYECANDKDRKGRFYQKNKIDYGTYSFEFDKQSFGYGPENIKNAIKIVVYNNEMIKHYYLGEVYGYDNQEIDLPKQHVMSETFSLIAQRELDDGTYVYDFLKPSKQGENKFVYVLYENVGKIVIRDAGDYIGAKLYISSISVNLGEEGNVIAGNYFIPYGPKQNIVYRNPANGNGGCFQENLEDVRKRFARDLSIPKTAVTAQDYKVLVADTPGLCISKVNVWMDYDKNEVQLVVMPGSEQIYPKLSDTYTDVIKKYIDDKRLLSTKINIMQPVYAPVYVRGTIYVKPHYEGCAEQIEQVIRDEIDYINGDKQFGQTLRFDALFHRIEYLDCVSYIYELDIKPQNSIAATLDGVNIKPDENCLLYLGTLKLDILPAIMQPI